MVLLLGKTEEYNMVSDNLCNCKNCETKWKNFDTLTKKQLEYVNARRFETFFNPGENVFKQGSPASNAVFPVVWNGKDIYGGPGQ